MFIKGCHIYTGHVGDSGISLGMQEEQEIGRGKWVSEHLTVVSLTGITCCLSVIYV